jgi:hypothetical protein
VGQRQSAEPNMSSFLDSVVKGHGRCDNPTCSKRGPLGVRARGEAGRGEVDAGQVEMLVQCEW